MSLGRANVARAHVCARLAAAPVLRHAFRICPFVSVSICSAGRPLECRGESESEREREPHENRRVRQFAARPQLVRSANTWRSRSSSSPQVRLEARPQVSLPAGSCSVRFRWVRFGPVRFSSVPSGCVYQMSVCVSNLGFCNGAKRLCVLFTGVRQKLSCPFRANQSRSGPERKQSQKENRKIPFNLAPATPTQVFRRWATFLCASARCTGAFAAAKHDPRATNSNNNNTCQVYNARPDRQTDGQRNAPYI